MYISIPTPSLAVFGLGEEAKISKIGVPGNQIFLELPVQTAPKFSATERYAWPFYNGSMIRAGSIPRGFWFAGPHLNGISSIRSDLMLALLDVCAFVSNSVTPLITSDSTQLASFFLNFLIACDVMLKKIFFWFLFCKFCLFR